MNRPKQIITSILLFLTLIILGIVGYMVIEHWRFMDSLYMTIITLATVGYGEVRQVSEKGRIFTILLILLGGGFFLYLISDIIKFLVEGRIRLVLGRYKLDNQIKKLKGHYIVCGYGRIGKLLTRYLIQKYIDVVVIERDHDLVETMNEDGILYLMGEAANENLLIRAGIERAVGIIGVVATDAENVFLVLLAKQLNPKLFVVARATQDLSKKTLLAAGADKVISPYDIGARRMAHAILRPTVIKFLEMAFADDTTDIQIEELLVKPGSKLIGVKLIDSGIRKDMDLIIIAIQNKENRMIFNPKADTKLEQGDIVVVMGCAKSIKQLELALHG
ncbi:MULTISPECIES: potassium channel family protein [Desulfobacula]|uniref:TrkaA2: Trk system potassium uptake protein trkA homolog n=2 Tax=Desulfobacula TaxID=28222 RepID=K0NFG4_DESTT|nr:MULTISPECIES: potassium channel protein [Desulfobacula]CCK79861.1 TrkaA2: Trk system potassium uptake protein trkA homolog [Desulfobacula toluolica Tol2]SDU20489.1 voltage-gated potassium channel [Desulfobacula phenolica]